LERAGKREERGGGGEIGEEEGGGTDGKMGKKMGKWEILDLIGYALAFFRGCRLEGLVEQMLDEMREGIDADRRAGSPAAESSVTIR
jgi:hypothetical protein